MNNYLIPEVKYKKTLTIKLSEFSKILFNISQRIKTLRFMLNFSDSDSPGKMFRTFFNNQIGPETCWEDIFDQVWQVDFIPNFVGKFEQFSSRPG